MLQLAQLGHVGVGAEPAYHRAAGVPNGPRPAQKPAVLPVVPPQREGVFPGLPGLDGGQVPGIHAGCQGGVVHLHPAPALHGFQGRARVVVPLLVVPENVAGGVGHPGQLRNVVGEGRKIGAAPGQLLGAFLQFVHFNRGRAEARQLAIGIGVRLRIGSEPAQLAVVTAAAERGLPGLARGHGGGGRGTHGGAVIVGQGQPGVGQRRGRVHARVFVEVRVGVGDGPAGIEIEDEDGHRSRDGAHLLVTAGHFRREGFGLPAGAYPVGHVHGKAQHAGYLPGGAAQALVRKVEVELAPLPGVGVGENQWRFLAPKGFAGVVHLVEHCQKPLAHQLRKARGQRLAQPGAVFGQGIVARVGESKAVLGAFHGGNEGGRLRQNLPQLLGAGGGGPQLFAHVQQAHQQVAQRAGGGGVHGLQRGLPINLHNGIRRCCRSPAGFQNLGFAVAGGQQAGRPGIGRGQVVAGGPQACAQGRQGLARPAGGFADARQAGQCGIHGQYQAVRTQHHERGGQRRKQQLKIQRERGRGRHRTALRKSRSSLLRPAVAKDSAPGAAWNAIQLVKKQKPQPSWSGFSKHGPHADQQPLSGLAWAFQVFGEELLHVLHFRR